jgi:hypothetical protein
MISSAVPCFAQGPELTEENLRELARHYDYFFVLEETDDTPFRYLYVNNVPSIHAYSIEDGRSVQEWVSTGLGSQVTACFMADLYGDGKELLVIATAGGRVMAYDPVNYDHYAENYLETFSSVSCLTVANLDEDPQLEIIFIADNLLNIYDSLTRAREWRSMVQVQATEILVANVDDDEQLEIILNTGLVVDTKFYSMEPSKVGAMAFGRNMRLLDTNGDGFPEVFGELPSKQLLVYDLYAGRSVW